MLIAIWVFLPETCRSIVGDGSVEPTSIWHRSGWSFISEKQKDSTLAESLPASKLKKRVNAWAAVSLLGSFPLGPVLLYNGITFAAYYSVMSSLTFSLHEIYDFNDTQVGTFFRASSS
jgi:hypothetical protein